MTIKRRIFHWTRINGNNFKIIEPCLYLPSCFSLYLMPWSQPFWPFNCGERLKTSQFENEVHLIPSSKMPLECLPYLTEWNKWSEVQRKMHIGKVRELLEWSLNWPRRRRALQSTSVPRNITELLPPFNIPALLHRA